MTDRDSSERTDCDLADLIAAMAGGDEGGLAALYDRTHVWIHGLVKRIVIDDNEAEEVTLDVYLQVWKMASGYSRAKGSPVAWIGTLARSRAIDRWRALQPDRSARVDDFPIDEVLAAAAETAAETSLHEQGTLIRQTLAELSADQRAVIYLAYFLGLSQSEIAERLAMPLGTVKTHARNALIRLKALLAPYAADWHD